MAKTFTQERIAQMLAEARAKAAATNPQLVPHVENIQKEQHNGTHVDLSLTGIDLDSPQAVEYFSEMLEGIYLRQRVAVESDDVGTKPKSKLGVARDDIVYNAKQQEFIDRVENGESVVLIGAAGTGKTTCQRGSGKRAIESKKIGPLPAATKWLHSGVPGIAVLSFTNKAVNNIRHALPDEIKPHALTVHKVLEFAPVFYEIEDAEHPGEMKKTMRFEPQRNRFNPLPSALKRIVFEESSMISVELHDQLLDACPHNPQMIYLGDIQQLPPVFGAAILGFKMLELPVIELTEVYRQALNSPIISLAWKILAGDPKTFNSKTRTFKMYSEHVKKEVTRTAVPALEALSYANDDGKVIFQPWQKRLSADNALNTCIKQFTQWADQGYYNPTDDILLCPFNVSFGTVEINRGIAQHLGRKRNAVVFEVIAGFNKHYLAVGDRVLYAKEDAIITEITRNGAYLGKSFQQESEFLDRWGYLRTEDMDKDELVEHKTAQEGSEGFNLEAIDKMIEAAASADEERVTAASHIIKLKMTATDEEVVIESAGELNQLLGGYCLTVHKSQGSEWDSVFLILHQSHATMQQRELLYTAVTRAKKRLHIICETDSFEKGVQSQKIKGNTLAEKAEVFKGKMDEYLKKKMEQQGVLADDPHIVAFSLVPQWDKLAREAANHWWIKATKVWPQLAAAKQPQFGWKVTGSAAGMAWAIRNEISCNPVYLHTDANEVIAQVVPHELAHIIDWKINRQRGHGPTWKEVMRKLGLSPDRCHPWGKMNDILQRAISNTKGANKEGEEGEE